MNKDIISRSILCVLLIVFMYVTAACSVSEKKSNKKSNDTSENSGSKKEVNPADSRKNIFLDDATSFLRAAMGANAELLEEGKEGKKCFTLKELIGEYVSVDNPDTYTGVVKNVSKDTWEIYITNGEYKINGKKLSMSKKDVLEGNSISIVSCD